MKPFSKLDMEWAYIWSEKGDVEQEILEWVKETVEEQFGRSDSGIEEASIMRWDEALKSQPSRGKKLSSTEDQTLVMMYSPVILIINLKPSFSNNWMVLTFFLLIFNSISSLIHKHIYMEYVHKNGMGIVRYEPDQFISGWLQMG